MVQHEAGQKSDADKRRPFRLFIDPVSGGAQRSGYTRALATMSLMVALGVLLGMPFLSFTFNIGSIAAKNYSFSLTPAHVSGFLFGPLAGAAVAAVTDIVRALLFPINGLAYNPLFTIPFALMGSTPAFLCNLFLRRAAAGRTPGYPALLSSMLLSQLLWSCGLNTFLIASLYGRAFFALLPARLVGLLVVPMYAFVTRLFVVLYKKLPGR